MSATALHPDLAPEERRRLLLEGVDHFNAARFFEAHEVWEEVWRSTDAGAERAAAGPDPGGGRHGAPSRSRPARGGASRARQGTTSRRALRSGRARTRPRRAARERRWLESVARASRRRVAAAAAPARRATGGAAMRTPRRRASPRARAARRGRDRGCRARRVAAIELRRMSRSRRRWPWSTSWPTSGPGCLRRPLTTMRATCWPIG